jgi:hypothetical protein
VVATDPVLGKRIFAKCRTEDQARAKARELEQFMAQAAPIREPQDAGPRSVERLAGRYIEDHLSGLSPRFREKQTYLLGRWVLPRIGARTVTAWTPADSAAVIAPCAGPAAPTPLSKTSARSCAPCHPCPAAAVAEPTRGPARLRAPSGWPIR